MTVVRIESKIEKEIQEERYCLEEVRAQVSGGIGQCESDTEGKCKGWVIENGTGSEIGY